MLAGSAALEQEGLCTQAPLEPLLSFCTGSPLYGKVQSCETIPCPTKLQRRIGSNILWHWAFAKPAVAEAARLVANPTSCATGLTLAPPMLGDATSALACAGNCTLHTWIAMREGSFSLDFARLICGSNA